MPLDETSILDTFQVDLLWERLSEIFFVTAYPHFTLRKRRMWIAAPVPSSDHFDSSTIPRVAKAIQATKKGKFFALLMEPLINTPLGLVFPSSISGVEQYNNNCALFSYVLFDESLSWLIICTKEDYFLVVANSDFVSTVIGANPADAHYQFQEFIQEMSELEYSQMSLEQVLNKSTTEYLEAAEGEEVSF